MRPKFHFTTRSGWLNDPNGLVYYQGEYHLYYQHFPYGLNCNFRNMHWGHAVSRDLLHWEELPIALYPRENDFCYSGSAVIDWDNVTGFQTGDEPPLLAFFTSTGRGECLAYSNDRGRTFTEYEGNPIIRHNGRDPKVFYHPESQQWILVVYDAVNYFAFYGSKDLKNWTFKYRMHGFYECPELFKLEDKWVIFAANGMYQLGSFDGERFEPETVPRPLFEGHIYAAQTFNELDRRIMIAWMKSPRPLYENLEFSQQMTLPVELTLSEDKNDVLVNPAVDVPKEIYSSPDKEMVIEGITVPPAEHIEVIRDTMSVEIFVDHGKKYLVKALPAGD